MTTLPRPVEPGDIVKQSDDLYGDLFYYLILNKTEYGYDVLDLEDGIEYYTEFRPKSNTRYEIIE